MSHIVEVENRGKIYRVRFISGAGNREGIRRAAMKAVSMEFRGESVEILKLNGHVW